MANLTQLGMLENLNGVLLVDKPAGLAFASVVKAVKRKFNLVKVGHGGSLEAMASGLFVILIGDANRRTNDIMSADRAYSGTMLLGRATDTHDVCGRTLSERDVPPPAVVQERLAANLAAFKGDIFQAEPPFSSVRREGSSAYEVAETGEHAPMLSHVYRFDVMPREGVANKLDFTLLATKGVLVRTLVNDLGAALGCGACLESLRRVKVGAYAVEAATPFERILEADAGHFAAFVKGA